jgi:membrane associated rhomboid family serine protease
MGQAMVLILVNLALTFAVPGISIGGHLGGLAGGVAATYALLRFRMPPNRMLGFALAAGVGVASVVLAYVRVRGYGV